MKELVKKSKALAVLAKIQTRCVILWLSNFLQSKISTQLILIAFWHNDTSSLIQIIQYLNTRGFCFT